MRSRIVTLGIAVLLAGCSGVATRPVWVADTGQAYAPSRYLTGLGQGSSADEAGRLARGRLARAFENRGREYPLQDAALRRELGSSIGEALQGVRIVERWYDSERGLHHALAVLDRRQAAVRLREKLTSLDAASEAAMAFSRAEPDPLKQLGFALKSLRMQQERSVFQHTLKLVDPAGMGLPPRWGAGQLVRARDLLMERIRIAVRAEGRDGEVVSGLLVEGLASAGFREAVLPDADYLLSGSLDLEEFAAEGRDFANGSLRLELYDRAAKLRSEGSWAVTGEGPRPQAAREQAVGKVRELLRRELLSWLTGPAGESM